MSNLLAAADHIKRWRDEPRGILAYVDEQFGATSMTGDTCEYTQNPSTNRTAAGTPRTDPISSAIAGVSCKSPEST